MSQGTILFLNGTTSAGKTSTAHMLQKILEEPYLEAGIDNFLCMLPRRYFKQPLWDEILGKANQSGKMGNLLISGMHHSILALSNLGLNVVADHVLIEKPWLAECVELFHDKPAYLIGIKCPLEVVEQRELVRADNRAPGLARKQINFVHAHGVYDFEVDTSTCNEEECAQRIKGFLASQTPPHALRQLYAAHSE